MRASQIERFMALVDRREPHECWPWLGRTSQGYGVWAPRGRYRHAHRVAYLISQGEIPDGFVIDHVYARGCRRTDCVNPDHLEAVTNAENLRRGMSPSMISHRTNTCRNGHELSDDNVIIGSKDNRQCRICRNAWSAKRRHEENPDGARYKTGYCLRGHEMTADNTLSNKSCRTCQRARAARYREAKRQARSNAS